MHYSSNQTALPERIGQLLEQFPEATVALSLKDPSQNFTFEFNQHRVFHAASLMKVPVMMEIFRLCSLGELSMSDRLEVRNQFYSVVDQSTYRIEEDTDDFTYRYIGEKMTINDLIVQMITVSSNIATNLLLDLIDLDVLTATLEALQVKKSTVLRGVEDLKAFELGLNNTITSSDMAQMLEALFKGDVISREQSDAMINVLLSQKQNEMIPAGLPQQMPVAHKMGQITRIHHDAGIIYPPEGPPFLLVILIEGIEKTHRSANLGADLTRVIYRHIRA